jgi:hypothetical protein
MYAKELYNLCSSSGTTVTEMKSGRTRREGPLEWVLVERGNTGRHSKIILWRTAPLVKCATVNSDLFRATAL